MDCDSGIINLGAHEKLRRAVLMAVELFNEFLGIYDALNISQQREIFEHLLSEVTGSAKDAPEPGDDDGFTPLRLAKAASI
jgi:hypothetical protein